MSLRVEGHRLCLWLWGMTQLRWHSRFSNTSFLRGPLNVPSMLFLLSWLAHSHPCSLSLTVTSLEMASSFNYNVPPPLFSTLAFCLLLYTHHNSQTGAILRTFFFLGLYPTNLKLHDTEYTLPVTRWCVHSTCMGDWVQGDQSETCCRHSGDRYGWSGLR